MKTYINEMNENDTVDTFFLVKEKSSGLTKTGSGYLKLLLSDRSGEMEARIWTSVDALVHSFNKDDFVRTRGRVVSFQEHLQLNVTQIERVPDSSVLLADFFPVSERDVEEMFRSLTSARERVTNPHLNRLLTLFWEDQAIIERFKTAPASKWLHHNYLGGLLEHTLSVVDLVFKVASHYEGLNLDLLLTGAILHDLAKVDELSYARSFDYSDEGRLLGHIVLGIERLEEKIRLIPGFPKDLSTVLKHLLLSHHGQHIWGSPKKPMTIEAVMLHHLDDMDAKINGIRQFLRNQVPENSRWSSYHRAFEQFFYISPGWDQPQASEISEEESRDE
jgi:3'-5' exoribonuclease